MQTEFARQRWPGGVERRGEDAVDGGVELGVGHDDDVVLGAAERLHALPVLGGRLVDVVRDRRGADERDAVDPRMLEDRVHRRLAAVDEVDDAGRHDSVQELEGPLHGERVLLGRLDR